MSLIHDPGPRFLGSTKSLCARKNFAGFSLTSVNRRSFEATSFRILAALSSIETPSERISAMCETQAFCHSGSLVDGEMAIFKDSAVNEEIQSVVGSKVETGFGN